MTVRKIEPICAKGHDAYVIRQWSLTYNKFCAIRFGAFVLDFSLDFSCIRWKLSPLHERCCDILFKCAIVIWTTLTVRCRPFEHNKVHHPCCKLRVKRGVGQIYIVQSKQALPINYNHGTLEEGKKRRINQGKTSGQRTYADCHSLWSVSWNWVQR